MSDRRSARRARPAGGASAGIGRRGGGPAAGPSRPPLSGARQRSTGRFARPSWFLAAAPAAPLAPLAAGYGYPRAAPPAGALRLRDGRHHRRPGQAEQTHPRRRQPGCRASRQSRGGGAGGRPAPRWAGRRRRDGGAGMSPNNMISVPAMFPWTVVDGRTPPDLAGLLRSAPDPVRPGQGPYSLGVAGGGFEPPKLSRRFYRPLPTADPDRRDDRPDPGHAAVPRLRRSSSSARVTVLSSRRTASTSMGAAAASAALRMYVDSG